VIERIRRANVPLWAGAILIAAFVLTAVLGPFFAPYDLNYEEPLRFVGGKPITNPEPPSGAHWFGKDQRGRDIFTLMLHGLKFTLAFVVLVSFIRVALGGWIGIWLGMRNQLGETAESAGAGRSVPISATGLFGSIPAVVLLIILLNTASQTLAFWPVLLIQGAVLAAFGLPSTISTIRAQTEELKRRLSVLVARTMGATRGWLVRKHIFPMLKETLVILFVQDMILVLNLLGQLSLFKIFLGGTDVKSDETRIEYWSRSLEWVGLMGQNKSWVIAYPYLIWVPLAAYLALLLSFDLLSKGLERRYRYLYNKHPHV
jgi:peptide/nickel transport system permease protein